MASTADIAAAVDQFLKAPKRLVGADMPMQWGPGHSDNERATVLPLELGGEQSGAKLLLVGFPHERNLKFRLSILIPAPICRLDFTDETHGNTLADAGDRIPPIVQGPHYHSWPLNRRFCRGATLPTKLHNAAPFEIRARSFDAILRWFCTDTNIEGLPPDHRIALPTTDRLL